MKFVHIDGDVVRYRAGFAAEVGFYRAVCYDPEGTLQLTGDRFAYKSECERWCQEHCDDDEQWEPTYDPEPEPLANCLHSAKLVVEEIYDTLKLGAQRGRVYFSSSGETFRHRLATLRPYKGTRDPTHRPFWFDQIAEYFNENWPVHWSREGYEADDEIAIAHTAMGRGSCIASIDKDFDCVPGWHYNFVKKEKYNVDADTATRTFWTQVLVGDGADNVGGCPGIGPKRAAKIMYGVSTCDLPALIRTVYESAFAGDQSAGTRALIETCRLIWILQEPGQEPPIPEEWKEYYD